MPKPRYSFLDLAIFATVVAAIGFVWLSVREQRMRDALFASALPDVRVPVPSTAPPSNAYQREYDLTFDMFTRCVPVWDTVLAPLKGKPNVHYLEIGLFEGGSAVWMLENVLTHPTARLTGIDIFEGPVKARYFANIERSGSADKVTTIIEYSQLALRELPLNSFDVIYIDGSHAKHDVLEDAVLCWRLLKDDGVLIFDDYRGVGDYDYPDLDEPGAGASLQCPKPGIDRFVECFEEHFEVIHNSFQLILRKKPRNA